MEDTLGDRLKVVEQAEAGRRAVKGKPIMARLDGRGFSKFTRGMARPYDVKMSNLMIQTVAHLVQETHAIVGYTQSDEISLCWYEPEDGVGEYLFDGKFQKLTSTLAAMATAFFNMKLGESFPDKVQLLPTFDCRVWQPDDMRDAYLNFLWRQDDASKNSISMAAQAEFSHSTLQGVGSDEKKEMLAALGKPWDAHPDFFKTGTFVKRVSREVLLTEEQLTKIPSQHRPTGPVVRTFVEDMHLGPLRSYGVGQQALLFGSVE